MTRSKINRHLNRTYIPRCRQEAPIKGRKDTNGRGLNAPTLDMTADLLMQSIASHGSGARRSSSGREQSLRNASVHAALTLLAITSGLRGASADGLAPLANTALQPMPMGFCLNDRAPCRTLPVQVGAQTFAACFDTGSSNLWVTAGAAPLYQPGPQAVDLHETAQLHYGSGGSVQGEIFEDVVTTPGAPLSVQLDVLASTSPSFFPTHYPSCTDVDMSSPSSTQALLGMGPNDLLQYDTLSYPYKLAAGGARNAFTVRTCDTAATVTWGGYNPEVVTGVPQFTPWVGPYYVVTLMSLEVGDVTVPVPSAGAAFAVDTGSSRFVVPDAVYHALRAELDPQIVPLLVGGVTHFGDAGGTLPTSGTTFFQFPGNCVTLAPQISRDDIDATMPTLTVGFASASAADEPLFTKKATESYLLYSPGSKGAELCNMLDASYLNPRNPEFGGIDNSLGTAIMRGLDVIFDLDRNLVGFAPAGNDSCLA